jgi:apolipoprotein N-acyltransferase
VKSFVARAILVVGATIALLGVPAAEAGAQTSNVNPEDTSTSVMVWGGLFAVALVVVVGAIVIIVRRR